MQRDELTRNTELRTAFDRRYNAMEQERLSFLPHWQEIADFINPRSALINSSINYNKGGKVNQNILDQTATLAVRTLKSGLMAGLTSPSRPWFKLGTTNPDINKSAQIKTWFAQVESIMREVFSRSNLYMVLPLIYGELAMPGTAAMCVLEDERHVLRFYPYQTGTYLIAMNDNMRCDTLYRKFSMSCQQIIQMFGEENCSDYVKAQWKANQTQTQFEVCHVIEPNDDRKPMMVDARNKPFRSAYYETSANTGKFLRLSGFDEFPVMAPRWDIFNANDAYGYSPAMDALGMIKGLQKEHKLKYEAIDKYVRPTKIADSSLRTQIISTIPNGITYIDGLASNQHAGLRNLDQNLPNIEHLMGDIGDVRALIRRCFFEDMMQMLAQSDNPEMTAREIEERHAEKVLVLGPVMERLNDELFDPLIDRSFNICLRRGLIPPPPQEVQGQTLKVEYTSIMAQAMKLMGIANIEKTAQFVGGMANISPAALDKLDVDRAIDTYSEMQGIDPRIIRTDDQVKGLRDIRAKQQQTAQMASMAKPAESAAKAGKAMGETDPEQVKQLVAMMTGQAG